MPRVGYLIPEFPGQTHVWMWREISHLRQWGTPITIFSTRKPPLEQRARHAFANAAEAETIYLWPRPRGEAVAAVLWTMARHPLGLLKAAWLGATLPVDRRPAIKTVFPLLLPACILARHCRWRGVQRLHSHTCSNSAILCMMVKRILGMPFSMTLNANIEWWGGAMGEKFADAEFTVAITQRLLDQIHRDYPRLGTSQAILGRVGVDTRRWFPNGRNDRPGGKQVRLMTVGRLHASKGHDVLLRALGLLVDRGYDVSLRLAGTGPEGDRLQQLADQLGLEQRARFLSSVSEERISEELKTTDIFVLASHAEPLGVAYLEAMAMGVPTIGTTGGGVGEIITHGQDGILVPPNDPPALAQAIVDLMADDARRRIGQSGRAKIVRCFDSRLGAATLYERFMGSPPPGQPNSITPT